MDSILHDSYEDLHNTRLLESLFKKDRADILDLMLKQGLSPNTIIADGISVPLSLLDTAVEHRSLNCVQRLLEEPALELVVTDTLLNAWAQIDMDDTMLDFCIQSIAPRLFGDLTSFWASTPLPDQLTVLHAAQAGNWNLVRRICRERGTITAQESNEVLKLLYKATDQNLIQCCHLAKGIMTTDESIGLLQIPDPASGQKSVSACSVLDTLLCARPSLLRSQKLRFLMALAFLFGFPDAAELLDPWIQKMRSRRVSLKKLSFLLPPWSGTNGLLAQWSRCLDGRLTPVLARGNPLPDDHPAPRMSSSCFKPVRYKAAALPGGSLRWPKAFFCSPPPSYWISCSNPAVF